MRSVRFALFMACLACAAGARGEIQTLYRGDCFSGPESAAKLGEFSALYNSREEWQARAVAIRENVRRGMKLERLPPACPLKPIRHSVRKDDGYTVENVAFESLPGFWATGNLYLPEHTGGKAPGVLSPHGHGFDARMNEATQTRCAALARMGAIVFAYDMVGYGDSQPVPHRHSETMRLQTYNSMRVVDFLLSLGTVDETRLAVTGESGGGTQSFLLACVDDRIDVSVPVVQVSAHFYGGCVCESGLPIHKSPAIETDNVEIAATFAPKPQLIVSDGGDWTANVPNIEFPYLQRVYGLCEADANIENAHFAMEKHDYGPSKRAAMYRFLAKHFHLDLARIQNAAGEIDEKVVTVHTRDELRVFTPDHPRPEYAVPGADDVLLELDRREEK